jgi:hypothetical protein
MLFLCVFDLSKIKTGRMTCKVFLRGPSSFLRDHCGQACFDVQRVMRAHNDRIAIVIDVRWRPTDRQANRVKLRGWHDKRLVSRAFRI